jgi:hypothetical protein
LVLALFLWSRFGFGSVPLEPLWFWFGSFGTALVLVRFLWNRFGFSLVPLVSHRFILFILQVVMCTWFRYLGGVGSLDFGFWILDFGFRALVS